MASWIRATGYYIITYRGKKEIAYWDGEFWQRAGFSRMLRYADNDLDKVGKFISMEE